ncbi:zinc ABC transporter substrate-binding protein AztC [Microbacterium halotolerans]|uniref:zinc ABC transporter substrate-binding protein AztC n=1 Tax=Microbacterium halotolerans TaxID=246613 RepID=UPI001968EDA3|nr:zinc ABC transporter substrate-binding protein AztC [Microbacterium halotolerans]
MTRPIRRTALLAFVGATAAAALVGCAPASGNGAHIVATTNILGDVVRQIAGDEAGVTTLMKPNADPHSFEISAQEAAGLAEADLLVSNGLGLEENVEQHLATAAGSGAARFVAGDHITPLSFSSGVGAGDDPHFWTDPDRMADVVMALGDEIAGLPGVDVSAIEEHTSAYLEEIDALEAEMTAAFEAIPDDRRALVTNHHVFGYLADRFGFDTVGAVIPSGTTLASPSAADLESLATAIESAGVPAIFAESSQPDRLVQVLADEVGIDVAVVELFSESLTEPEGEAPTYLDMMRVNTDRIAQGLTR